jgi:hypothetical protein
MLIDPKKEVLVLSENMLTGRAHCPPRRELLLTLSSQREVEGWPRRLTDARILILG